MMRTTALSIVAFLVSIATAAAADFYQSNELGMRLAQISESQRGEHRWVLEVDRSGEREIRTLTDNGEVAARWKDTFRGGRLATESVFDKENLTSTIEFKNGHPIEQSAYTEGELTEVRRYTYSGGLLKSVAVYDGKGNLKFTDTYAEGIDGRLRRAVRELPDGKRSVAAFTYSGDRVVAEWLGSGGAGVLFRYSGGSLAAKEHWNGTDLATAEEISNGSNGSTAVTTDFTDGTITTKRFNGAGKILSEAVTKKGIPIETVEYSYRDGRLLTKVAKSAGHREEVSYEYDSGGELVSSQTTVNRKLVKVTHYTAKDSYVDDLYLNGAVVLHVYYENGKKVKEVAAAPVESAGPTTGTGG